MSTKRKSAFSIYKMQQQAAKKDEAVPPVKTFTLDPDMEIIETNGEQVESPSGVRTKMKSSKNDTSGNGTTESKEKTGKRETKTFSRASKLRHSIGNIGLNKKKRKTHRTQEPHETDSEREIKKGKKEAIICSSEIVREEDTSVPVCDPVFNCNETQLVPKKTFEWLICPVKTDKFFSGLWEHKPLLVKRHEGKYYEGIFSTAELEKILRESFQMQCDVIAQIVQYLQNNIQFSVNLDITSYKDGHRETHNPTGRALAPVVWDFYQNGCSVRLLNPQTFSDSVWKLNAALHEYFGSFVGANVYLTPPDSQGFAPHYDDIEAFVLQLEGKKHWRLYNPRNDSEILPRFSSNNLSQEEIGDPILDVVLEPGDLLYFPRGTIHQADTSGGPHSLHVTLSTYQKTSWGDFMEELIPRALQIAIEEDVEFRRGLPLRYLSSMGVANSESSSKERSEFFRHVEQLLRKLVSYLPVDGAVDQMGIKNVHDSLPPFLTKEEKKCSIFLAGTCWQDGQVTNAVPIDKNTALRLIRKDAVRLVLDDEGVVVYHNLDNSRVYHEQEPQYIEFTLEASPVIENMVKTFPQFVKVKDLPGDDLNYKIDLITMLYEKGILITRESLTLTVS